ncbi:MAG TPA: alpha/beta fold hydrolase [Abditibacterium sp.]|jgi:alpha-beta hydrolase superfamily lysophospholipase
MTENAVIFSNERGENLVGVWHLPDGAPRAAIVMLHGWSGTRCGPHQMLTRAARRLAAQGFAVLRFDFAGRGDSDGDTILATLATMQKDAKSAQNWVRTQTNAPLLLLGLCSGCEIVVAAANSEIAGVILWSAPVFAALPAESGVAQKRGKNLQKYARKLFSLATYRKLWRGEIDTKSVSKAIQGGGGAASKNLESEAPGQLPPGFRAASLAKWQQFAAPRLQIYGGADPILEDALAWYQNHSNTPAEVAIIAGANHSFYGLGWEREVIDRTLLWLHEKFENSAS